MNGTASQHKLSATADRAGSEFEHLDTHLFSSSFRCATAALSSSANFAHRSRKSVARDSVGWSSPVVVARNCTTRKARSSGDSAMTPSRQTNQRRKSRAADETRTAGRMSENRNRRTRHFAKDEIASERYPQVQNQCALRTRV